MCVARDEGVALVIAVLKISGGCCRLAGTAAARLGCPPYCHWLFVKGRVKFAKSSAILLLELKVLEELSFQYHLFYFLFPAFHECRLVNFNVNFDPFFFLKKLF